MLLNIAITSIAQTKKDTNSNDNYGDDRIFTSVQVESEFRGGVSAWINFITKHLNPDVPTDKGAPTGKSTVEVIFVVDRDGTISDIKALTKKGYRY